jgi:NDP-sugar pyrophosphorylase family protein
MILAAGYGSRLGALGQERPKPLLPFCGAPLIVWTVRWLVANDVREIVVNLHHLGDQIVQVLGDGSHLGAAIEYSQEQEILGTGGGLRQARNLLVDGSERPILVVNGKLIQTIDVASVLAHHRASKAEATMVVRRDAEGVWGQPLRRRADGRLVELLGESSPHLRVQGDLDATMFTGIHLFAPTFLDRIDPHESAPCIIKGAYRQLFRETVEGSGGLTTYLHEGYWWEHSTPQRYIQGIAQVLGGALAPCDRRYFPGPAVHESATIELGARVDPRAYLGEGVRVKAGARIGWGVALERDVVVESTGDLERVVAWEGSQVEGRRRDEVLR